MSERKTGRIGQAKGTAPLPHQNSGGDMNLLVMALMLRAQASLAKRSPKALAGAQKLAALPALRRGFAKAVDMLEAVAMRYAFFQGRLDTFLAEVSRVYVGRARGFIDNMSRLIAARLGK